MFKESNPLLSDEFLDEIVKEINLQFGNRDQMDDVSPSQDSSV
jgi:hypothetical protein